MQPYLQAVTTNSIYVLVECSTTENVTVSFGTSLSFGNSANTTLISTTTNSTYVHKIQLTGLLANTQYFYKAEQGLSVSNTYSFTTAVNPGTSFRVAWMADCRTGTSFHDQISALILTYSPKFSFYGGDYCANPSYASWKSEFFRTNELNLISQVPFYPAVGNHENWETNSQAFTRNPDSPSGTQDYYSFDYGDVHFLCLNNMISYAVGSPQYNFAQSDLSSTSKHWKIVFYHMPAYCSGGHGENEGMKIMSQNIFAPNNVDMIFSGDSHMYQHNYVDGVHHMILGSAGAPLYIPAYSYYTIHQAQEYDFGIIDVTPTSMILRVFNNNNGKLDSIAIMKPPVTSGPISGLKSVGPAPSDFKSITQAFEYMRNIGNGINGPVVLELKTDYSGVAEVFPLTLTAISGTSVINTITIRPAVTTSGVTLSSDNSTGTLNLNGIKHLNIDGRPAGIGNSQLTIDNQSTTGFAIQLMNDASNNIVRFCMIKGVNVSTSCGVVFINTTTLTDGNDNNLIEYCVLRNGLTAPANLVYSNGSTGKSNSSNTFSNNEFLNFTNSAIYLSATGNGDNWTVSANSFYSTLAGSPSADKTVISFNSALSVNNLISGNFIGGGSTQCGGTIWPVNGNTQFIGIKVVSANVTKNKISNIGSSSVSVSPVIYGIVNSGISGINNEFSNNLVAIDGGIATNPAIYGFYDNSSSGGTFKVWNNSIHLYGNPTSTSSTCAIRLNNGSSYTINDNIFYNQRLPGGSGNHYAIYNASAGPFISDYNILRSTAGPLGYYNSANLTTLDNWQQATGEDSHSKNNDPLFVSSTDLLLLSGSPALLAGVKLPGNSMSYNGKLRTIPPDIGAYQNSNPPSLATWRGNLSNDWDTPANWSSNIVPGNISDVIIGGTAFNMPTISDAASCNNLTMESGATLLGNSHLEIAGETKIKRTISGNWSGGSPGASTLIHYLSSPVSGATAAVCNGSLLNHYDETSEKWIGITDPSTIMYVGEGYSVTMPAPGGDVVFTGGEPNYGDKTISGLSYTLMGNSDYTGWHLLGNPFPSAIDWDLGNWNRNNLDATVYVWDATAQNYKCRPAQSGFGTLTDGIIPTGQGFMVHVSGAVTGSITIPEAARVHTSLSFYKTHPSDLLGLEIIGNNFSDKMFIHFMEGATNGFDPEFDAFKLMGNEQAPQIYSMLSDHDLTINVLPVSSRIMTIPIAVKIGTAGNYRITASDISTFADGTGIFLEDLKSQEMINLAVDHVYNFIGLPGDEEHRFNLAFSLVGIDKKEVHEMNIYSKGTDIYINIPFAGLANVFIYDLPGRLVSTSKSTGNSLNRISMDRTPGYYIVKVVCNEKTVTAKVFIFPS